MSTVRRVAAMQAGKTPLDSAIKSRRRDCINVLRDALEVGRIELQGALIRGDVSKVKSIMKKGGDIDFFDKEVGHHRFMLRRTRVIMDAYLLAGPHSLCLQTGETALHVAAYHGNHEIVEYLLSIGSSPFVKNKVRGCQAVLRCGGGCLCTLTQDCRCVTVHRWDKHHMMSRLRPTNKRR